jgi:hypothetical protein
LVFSQKQVCLEQQLIWSECRIALYSTKVKGEKNV